LRFPGVLARVYEAALGVISGCLFEFGKCGGGLDPPGAPLDAPKASTRLQLRFQSSLSVVAPGYRSAPMSDDNETQGLRERLTKQGEDTLGKLAQELLENPIVNGAIARAFEAREKAAQAQEVAMGALNIPSAADLERLTRRVRSLSQRLEGIEDGVDRLDERLAGLGAMADLDRRLSAIEAKLDALAGARGGQKEPAAS
jgi:hypothetical protein